MFLQLGMNHKKEKMRVLDYYFIKEYQWKLNWFSKSGLLKVNVFPTNEFIREKGYVNFNIVGEIFLAKKEFLDIKYINSTISKIKQVITGDLTIYEISNECVLLEIKKIYTRPISLLGDSTGEEAPLSWNLSTPVELQKIPTKEILQLFKDWKQFLNTQKDVIIK